MWRVVVVFDACSPLEPRIERLDASGPAATLEATPDHRRHGDDVDRVLLDAGREAHLSWRIERVGATQIEAAYQFDVAYASAHPESIDSGHLSLWHGVLCAKIFDDGDIVLDDYALVQSLRWKSVHKKSSRLRRNGTRH